MPPPAFKVSGTSCRASCHNVCMSARRYRPMRLFSAAWTWSRECLPLLGTNLSTNLGKPRSWKSVPSVALKQYTSTAPPKACEMSHRKQVGACRRVGIRALSNSWHRDHTVPHQTSSEARNCMLYVVKLYRAVQSTSMFYCQLPVKSELYPLFRMSMFTQCP
jgi:hypothetical protein